MYIAPISYGRKNIPTAFMVDGEPLENALYVPETTQRKHLGTRGLTWDGRVFKYAKSGDECYAGRGNIFYNAIPATGIDYSLLAADAPVGSLSVKMTNQGVVAQTEDGLCGGQIVLKPAAGSSDAILQFRGVIGNTAGGVSDVITIYLDAPLDRVLTSGVSYGFVMPSPWSDVRYTDALTKCSHCGVAAAYVSAANYFHWEQTWGKCWIAPQAECGTLAYGREVVWRYDGSIQHRGSSGIDGLEGQLAGFIMDNNEADNGSTVIFLQITPI